MSRRGALLPLAQVGADPLGVLGATVLILKVLPVGLRKSALELGLVAGVELSQTRLNRRLGGDACPALYLDVETGIL